jgi:hypothetical protein
MGWENLAIGDADCTKDGLVNLSLHGAPGARVRIKRFYHGVPRLNTVQVVELTLTLADQVHSLESMRDSLVAVAGPTG